jgi:hypothetical protein
MKDMKADPKKRPLVIGMMDSCAVLSRSQTVPIMMARPRYMAKRIPKATMSR